MLARKTLAALASLAVAGAGMLFMASLAHADQTATINCTRGGNIDRTLDGAGPWTFVLGACGGFPVVSVSRTADDIRGPADDAQVTVFNDPAGNEVYNQSYTGDANVFGGGDKFSPTINHGVRIAYERDGGPEVGTIIVDFKDEVDAEFKQTFEITLGDGGGGGGGDTPSGNGGSTDAISGPAPHIQQFGMPETGTCDEAQPESLNWGGVSSGGWGESWAQWMADGLGGAVCTRTLIYNTSKAAWEVD